MFCLSRLRTLFLKLALLVGAIMLSAAGVVSAGQDQDNASTTASETTKSSGKSSWAIFRLHETHAEHMVNSLNTVSMN